MTNESGITMTKAGRRAYDASSRREQADETRKLIMLAARSLFVSRGFIKTTVGAIAKKSKVAESTLYAIFGSKYGLLIAIIDAASFGPEYDALVARSHQTTNPAELLGIAAQIARVVHGETASELDILAAVAGSMGPLERQRQGRRFERQGQLVEKLVAARRLKKGLTETVAHDIVWALTCRELYRMLIRDRKWSGEQYESWLAATLVSSLLQ